ncbi:hypothetical protein P154DRAFT_523713 [Amniculicola lignicola CBS 123094]|uniref:Swi5-domain-containing protein n=1 Tax=Amniculicola lignicola CBS 123094 TaxID=1392246 RepID=A0A6A5WAF8_9PLEO|nr:hypothetical protein P154DRAFT_523713 [Amniculicola lignicola CBS 123094]
MVLRDGVTEIADSEDDPMSSSPILSSDATEKLHGDTPSPLWAPHDEPQEAVDEHQASDDHVSRALPTEDAADKAYSVNHLIASANVHPANKQTETVGSQQQHVDQDIANMKQVSQVQGPLETSIETEIPLNVSFSGGPSLSETEGERGFVTNFPHVDEPGMGSHGRGTENTSGPNDALETMIPLCTTDFSNSFEKQINPEIESHSHTEQSSLLVPPKDEHEVFSDGSEPTTQEEAPESSFLAPLQKPTLQDMEGSEVVAGQKLLPPNSASPSSSVADEMDVGITPIVAEPEPASTVPINAISRMTTEESSQPPNDTETNSTLAATEHSSTQPIGQLKINASGRTTEQQLNESMEKTEANVTASPAMEQDFVGPSEEIEPNITSPTISQEVSHPNASWDEHPGAPVEAIAAVEKLQGAVEPRPSSSNCTESATPIPISLDSSLQHKESPSGQATDPSKNRPEPGQQPPLSSPTKSTTTSNSSMPFKPSQEHTVAELRAQRAALIASLAVLPNIQELLISDDSSTVSDVPDLDEPTDADIIAAANKIVKKHIKLLHEYNEIKDVGQGLMGLIADQRGVRIVEVQDEFGVTSKD